MPNREEDLGPVIGPRGPQGVRGPQGIKGDTIFQLEVDSSGNLYAVYQDGTTPPAFDFDEATGNLYLLVSDD